MMIAVKRKLRKIGLYTLLRNRKVPAKPQTPHWRISWIYENIRFNKYNETSYEIHGAIYNIFISFIILFKDPKFLFCRLINLHLNHDFHRCDKQNDQLGRLRHCHLRMIQKTYLILENSWQRAFTILHIY